MCGNARANHVPGRSQRTDFTRHRSCHDGQYTSTSSFHQWKEVHLSYCNTSSIVHSCFNLNRGHKHETITQQPAFQHAKSRGPLEPCVCTTLVHECRGVTPHKNMLVMTPCNMNMSNFSLILTEFTTTCRGVQHHWHTARNEAVANGGKESGTLDSVPARTAP